MALSDEFLSRIRDNTDIEQLISGYVNLKRSGRILRGLCPFHSEKTPSFTVYPDTQSYYCFGCGKGGDAINFVCEAENLNYIDAVKLLAERANISMPEYDSYDDSLSKQRRLIYEINRKAAKFYYDCLLSEQGKTALKYYEGRGFSPATVKHFGLGYAPDGWRYLFDYLTKEGYYPNEIVSADLAKKSVKNDKVTYYDTFRNKVMTPIIDIRGNVVAFGGRVLDNSKPKYINTADTLVYKKSNTIFALNFAKSSKREGLILVEGYMDVISLHSAGFDNAIACCGTALTDEQVKIIERYCSKVFICYDNDEAGKKATQRALQKFSNTPLEVKSISISGGKDPDEIIKKYGPSRFSTLLEGAANSTEYRLAELQSKYDVNTDDGRMNYIRNATDILATLADPVERDIYISRIADSYSVDRDAIKQNVDRIIRRKERRGDKSLDFNELLKENFGAAADKTVVRPDDYRAAKARNILLSTLIRNPDFVSQLEGELSEDDFGDDFSKRLYREIKHRTDDNLSLDIMLLSKDFNQSETSRIARLMSDTELLSNTVEECRDCIQVLKTENLKKSEPDAGNLSDEDFLKAFKKNE